MRSDPPRPRPVDPSDGEPRRPADAAPAGSRDPDDLDRLAALDDCLCGHPLRDPHSAETGEQPPAGLDVILLLRQLAAADQAAASADEAGPPPRIGRYEIVREVGRGGFARVYEAVDTRLGRRVALKVARPEALLEKASKRRFIREAELAARLVHPNIVTILEAGEDGETVYIAEEFCSGGSLGEWLDGHSGPMPPRDAARVVLAIASAVAHCHAFGILHRDIKPGNVLLTPATDGPLAEGPGGTGTRFDVRLGDFGLGKLAPESSSEPPSEPTRSGARVGTLSWMAPEQADSTLGPVGPATDIHGLGLLLDRLLTGRTRFAGESDAETLRKLLTEEPTAPDRVVPTVPRDLAAVTLRCLARCPLERYPAAIDLAADLRRFLAGEPTVARPVSRIERTRRWLRRYPFAAAAGAVALLASGIAIVAVALQVRQEAQLTAQLAEIRRHQAAATLRRGFEARRIGDVAGALKQLAACRGLDPALADSLGGRWLLARLHGEDEILLEPATAEMTSGGDGATPDLQAVAVSPDGQSIATGGADGGLRILPVAEHAARRARADIVAVGAEINELAYSPDGRSITVACQDGSIHIVDVAGRRRLHTWRFDGGAQFGVAWAPDGAVLACGGEARTVRLLRADGAPAPIAAIAPFDPPANGKQADAEVEAVAFIDRARLAVACGDRVVIIDWNTGRVVHELQGVAGSVAALAVSADGGRLLAAGSDGTPRIWDTATGALVAALPLHPSWTAGACFTADGGIVTTCRDGVVRSWTAAGAKRGTDLVGHVGRVWDVAALPDGDIVSAGADGTLRRWSTRRTADGAPFHELRVEWAEQIVGAITLAPAPRGGGLVVATQQPDRFTRLDFDGRITAVGTDEVLAPWPFSAEERSERIAALGPIARAGTWPIPGSADTSVHRPPRALADEDPVWSGPAGLLLTPANTLAFWDERSGTAGVVDELPATIDAAAVTFAGIPRAAVVTGKAVVVYALSPEGRPRVETRRTVLELAGSSGRVTTVAWSPDGKGFALGTNIGEVDRYDAATGMPLGRFAQHGSAIHSLAWSADGRILVSADARDLHLSDVETTTVLDEHRPGWSVVSMHLLDRGDSGTTIVLAGNEEPREHRPGTAIVAVACFDAAGRPRGE